MDTMTAQEIIDRAVYESSIDGQTGAAGRHTPTMLFSLLNSSIASLRSLVSQAGYVEFQEETSGALPGATAGEEYQIVAYPDGAYEIRGVDLLTGSQWNTMIVTSWGNRRDVVRHPDGYGYWSIKKLPRENGASAPTAGEIAIFPPGLSGTYKIWWVKPWTPITSANGTYLVILYPDWLTWIVQSMVMTIVKRDNNKKAIYAAAQNEKDAAERRIRVAANQFMRTGPRVPRRADGLDSLL